MIPWWTLPIAFVVGIVSALTIISICCAPDKESKREK